MKTKLLTVITVATLLASCEKSESTTAESYSEVSFSTGIATRATGTTWDIDDVIGVSMFLTGETNVYNSESSNAEYTIYSGGSTSTATFTSTDPLYFPQQNKSVDFVAYYPYSSLTDGAVVINTESQTEQREIDFMVARAVGCSESDPDITSLTFSRMMSKIVLNIKRNDNATSLTLSNFVISGAVSEGTFALNNYSESAIALSTSKESFATLYDEDSDSVEALLIPQTLSGSTLTFYSGDTKYTASLNVDLEEGLIYTFNLYVGGNTTYLGEAIISDWIDADLSPSESEISYEDIVE